MTPDGTGKRRSKQGRRRAGAAPPPARAAVTRAEVLRIAQLAELALDQTEAVELEGQLSRILDYVAQLGELAGDEPGEAAAAGVRLRADVPGHADPLALPPAAWAPAFRGGLFVVPRLVEQDQGEGA